MRRTIGTLFFAATLTLALPAGADESALDRMLGNIEAVPTRVQMDRALDNPSAQLRQAAADSNRSVYQRQRAITLLSAYPDASTRAFLEATAADTSLDVELRKLAMYTLGRAFGGNPTDAKLAATVGTYVADGDPKMAAWAVRTLRWISHPDAGAILEKVAAGSDANARLARRALSKRTDADSSENVR